MDKLIVNCAITGSRNTREQTPHIPVTPEEIIDSALEAARAGASIVHIHVRDRKTGLGAQDMDLFRQVRELGREIASPDEARAMLGLKKDR